MAKNVNLLGVDYNDVPATTLPQTGGGVVKFIESSELDGMVVDKVENQSIVEITDGSANPVNKLVITLQPIQSGSGDPYPPGGGINIWDEEWLNGYYDTSGAFVSSANYVCSKNMVHFGDGDTLYLVAPVAMTIRLYDENKNFLGSAPSTWRNETIKPTTYQPNARYLHLFNAASGSITTYNHDISINHPSTDHDYHPYSNIRPITGHDGVTVSRTGKNLADFKEGYSINADGEVVSYAGRIATVDPIYIKNGNSYVVNSEIGSFIYSVFNGNTLVRRVSGVSKGTTLNTSGGNKLYVCNYSTQSITIDSAKPIVRLSTQQEGYAAYTGTTYPFTFPTPPGTVYGGTLTVNDDGTGTLVVDRASLTINGTEPSWGNASSGNNYHQFVLWLTAYETSSFALCDRFGLIALADRGTKTGLVSYDADNGYRFALTDDMGIETMDQWKSWLSTNNVQLVVKLSTPVTYQLTNQQVIETLEGVNNVWADDGEIKLIEYIVDMDLFMQRKYGIQP